MQCTGKIHGYRCAMAQKSVANGLNLLCSKSKSLFMLL
nr:unnamed protein product [Callosobruchus analis]CAI5861870.1 unnamed protein product [Callosobruchus analis]